MMNAVPPAAEPAMMAVRLLEVEGDDSSGIVLGNEVEVWGNSNRCRLREKCHQETYKYLRSVDISGICRGDGGCRFLLRRRCRRL